MSRNCFIFIRTHLSLSDKITRENRWQHDCFAVIRKVFEVLKFGCMSCLVPDDYLSLDETLDPMRAQISFKQYNPNKPAKYWLLLKGINAVRCLYALLLLVLVSVSVILENILHLAHLK